MTNMLSYGLDIKQKTKGQDDEAKGKKVKKDDEEDEEGDALELESIEMEHMALFFPTTGIVTGGDDGERVVDVVVNYDTTDPKKQELGFLFPAFELGHELYFDPTLTGGAGSNMRLGAGAGVVALIAAYLA
jgi:hypothetical protein